MLFAVALCTDDDENKKKKEPLRGYFENVPF